MTFKVWSRIAVPSGQIEIGGVRLNDNGHELGYVE
jgi:hypothetical protein